MTLKTGVMMLKFSFASSLHTHTHTHTHTHRHIYIYIYIYIIHLNCNISQHCCFSCIFDHIRPPCVDCVTVRRDPVAVCALFCQCIYGHPGGPLFCKKIFAPILHHQQNPEFYEEVRRLPLNSTYLRLCSYVQTVVLSVCLNTCF